MSFVEMNLDDVVEQGIAPEGNYTMTINHAVIADAKSSGKPQIVVGTNFADHTEYMGVRVYLGLPHEDDEPETAERKKRSLKRFLHLFNIPCDGGFNIEDFFGASAEALVVQSEPNDNGDIYNNIIIPRIKE